MRWRAAAVRHGGQTRPDPRWCGRRDFQPVDQTVQHVHGCLGVRQRTMVRGDGRTEVPGQCRQPAVGHLVAEQDLPGQSRCRSPASGVGVLTRFASAAQEADVERGIVGDDHGAVREGKERWQHLA